MTVGLTHRKAEVERSAGIAFSGMPLVMQTPTDTGTLMNFFQGLSRAASRAGRFSIWGRAADATCTLCWQER